VLAGLTILHLMLNWRWVAKAMGLLGRYGG